MNTPPAQAGPPPHGPDCVAFGLDLFRRLARASPDENVIVSPLSAGVALSMLADGATDATLAGIRRALAAGEEGDALNAAIPASLQSDDVELAVANSLWARAGTPVLPAYVARSRARFGAEVDALDFSSEAAVERINGWVQRDTGGRIREIVRHPINPLTVLFLLNAVYFKAPWMAAFDGSRTRPHTFHAPGGDVERPMMSRSGDYGYLQNSDFSAVRMPYRGERFAMYVLLPADGGVARVRELLTAERWREMMERFRSREVSVAMPRYRVSVASKLNAPLSAMGMEDAFDPDRAALDGMMPAELVARWRPYVSTVLQKVFVEVNEQGTEAAAATKVEIRVRGLVGPPPVEFVVDRPFILAIRDDQTGALLFVGQVTDPVTE